MVVWHRKFDGKTAVAAAIMLATAFHDLLRDSAHGKKDADVSKNRYLMLDPRVIANVHNAQFTLEVTGMSAPRLLMGRERQSLRASPSTIASPIAR